MRRMLIGCLCLLSACSGDLGSLHSASSADDTSATPAGSTGEGHRGGTPSGDRTGGEEAELDAGEASPSSGSDDSDLTVDAGTPRPTTAPVFDDFESGSLDDTLWRVKGFEGQQMATATTAVLDGTHTHSGKSAVLIRDGFLETNPPARHFFGRAYAWFDADPGTGHWMSVIAVAPGQGRDTEVRYGGHYGILHANYYGNDDEVISDPKGYCAPTCDNGVAMPIGRWVCTEFYFGEEEMRLWLDGKEIDTLHVMEWRNQKAPWSPAYDRVRLGFHNFQGAAPKVWLDDVALGTERVGCD